MSLDIKDFLEQFVKPNALKLGGEVAIQDVTSSGGPVVPSTAKLFIPDISTLLTAIVDTGGIVDTFGLSGTASYSGDALWATFTASNVTNVTPFINVNDFYVNGFYNETEFTEEGGDILNIGYSGVVDIGILNGFPNPVYSGGNFFCYANIDTGTYDVLDFVQISVKLDVAIDYQWSNNGGQYFITGIFSNLNGPVVLSFDIEVDVDLDTVDWTIGILPNTLP